MEQIQLPKIKKRRLKRYFPLLLLIAVVAGGYFIIKFIKTRVETPEKIDVKQMCIQLIHDLQTDTANLQRAILFDSRLVHKNDSLLLILQMPVEKSELVKMRQLAAGSFFSKAFRPSTRAVTAISDHFRLKELANSQIPAYLADYKNSVDTLQSLGDLQAHDMDSEIRLFYRTHLAKNKNQLNNNSIDTSNLLAIPEDEVSNMNSAIELKQSLNNELILNSRRAKEKAVKLIDYLKKRYRI